jgi:hypothetical protein
MKPLEKAFSNNASPGSFSCTGCYCMCVCFCRCGSIPLEDAKWAPLADNRDVLRDDLTFDVQTY